MCEYTYITFLSIPYSGLCLRGPNFCEICEWLIDSQIFLLKWSGSYNLVRHVNFEWKHKDAALPLKRPDPVGPLSKDVPTSSIIEANNEG